MKSLEIIAVGDVPPEHTANLATDLDLPVEVSVGQCIALPSDAFVAGQYLATHVTAAVRAAVPEDRLALGVASVDLFVPRLTFVFGLADARCGAAVISSYRLDDEATTIFRRRILIEAVHEIGHLLGLAHCKNPDCVMFRSQTIGDSDRKGPHFCSDCSPRLG